MFNYKNILSNKSCESKNQNKSSDHYDLYEYSLQISGSEETQLQKLRIATASLHLANMQISPNQGKFLQFLIKILNVNNILELGTFTGYSALSMAYALPKHGNIITCDINPRWQSLAIEHWQASGLKNKITNKVCPAKELMYSLINDGKTFDLIFIDADKTNYPLYYQLAKELISNTGLIVIDNVLWHGKIADLQKQDRQTLAIRKLNETVSQDSSVEKCLIPIDDGLLLIKKIGRAQLPTVL